MIIMFEKGELSLLWRFYLSGFIESAFSMISIFWTVYLAAKGFSFAEIGLAMAAMSVSIFLFEVPTGAVADIYGRKISVILSSLTFILVCLAVPFIDSFILLLVLFSMLGIGTTLKSGAYDAWVVDLLGYEKRDDLIQAFFAKISSILSFGGLLSGIIFTSIIVLDGTEKMILYDRIWFLQGLAFTIGLMVILPAKEHFRRKKTHARHIFRDTFDISEKSLNIILSKKVLKIIFISYFFVSLSSSMWYIALQPFLVSVGAVFESLGLIETLVSIGSMISPLVIAYVIKMYGHRKRILILSTGTLAILMLSALLVTTLPGAISIYFFMIFFNAAYGIIFIPLINENIGSDIRATLMSFMSMFVSVATSIGMVMNGFLLDLVSPAQAFAASSIFMLAAMYFLNRLDA